MVISYTNLCTFTIISRWNLLRIINISEKFVQKIKTQILCLIIFFPENRAIYMIMWKNIVKPDRPQIIRTMRFAYWVNNATNTHSEYLTLTWRIWWATNNASKWQIGFNSAFKALIHTDFPRQKWLRERASVLGYKQIVNPAKPAQTCTLPLPFVYFSFGLWGYLE
jgi:hypothetical protein